ncbi:hypothetical protein STANM309S_04635 [Streptomyces tanashiensis]
MGAGARRAARRAVRHGRAGDARGRRHRAAPAGRRPDGPGHGPGPPRPRAGLDPGLGTWTRRTTRTRRPSARPTPSSTRARSGRSSPTRWAAPRRSPPASASAPPAPCCCPSAIPASAPRCGSSGSARPSSSRPARPSSASFPTVLEAVRECLQDVFDLPGLTELMGDVEARRVRLVEVTTPFEPSPFARSLLFGVRGAVPVRGRLPARRAAGGRALPGLPAARGAPRPRPSCASSSTPRSSRSWSGSSSG